MARNLDSGRIIATRVSVTATRTERALGLLGRDDFQPDEAMWIAPSRGVHTCGMRFPIDLVALDATGKVVDRVAGLAPWRLRLPRRSVVGVLELPEGSLERSETRLGHCLTFETVGVLGWNAHAGDA
jgi:hypothetical protein